MVENSEAGKIKISNRVGVQDVLLEWTFGVESSRLPPHAPKIAIALKNVCNSCAVFIAVKHVKRNIVDTVK